MSSTASRDFRRMSVTRECHRTLSVRGSRQEQHCHCTSPPQDKQKVSSPEVHNQRRIYSTIPECLDRYHLVSSPKRSNRTSCKQRLKDLLKGLRARLPLIDSLRTYDVKNNLLADVIAGLGTTGLHFPQGLAYGSLLV